MLILDNLLFSINAVMPIFIILILGYFLKEKGLIDQYTIKKMNAVLFNVALPMFLFRDISRSNFTDVFDLRLLIFAVGTTCLSFVLIWVVAEIFIKDKSSIGAFVQGSFRSNYALIGLALAYNVGGSEAVTKGALLMAFVIPCYNVLSVIVLTFRSKGNSDVGIKTALISIIKNPLIISIVLSLPFCLLQIGIPSIVNKSIDYMAGMATPLAMLAIGGTIYLDEIKNRRIRLAVVGSAIKLIVQPIIYIPIALFLGIRGNGLLVLYIMYGSPTAVSSYVMASNMNGDVELASDIFIITTLFSVITFTIGIYTFKVLGFIL
ncbi:AEC family transporter [Clostridiisalibacter paucivorans]|uniref:AEC family transporter n=1 Tax=Clostridiisalibacter paucivorans TaxID=408753 RepID=UPI00054E3540|nr:AEC family transporter [Clostridiisalibacter paucivorans]